MEMCPVLLKLTGASRRAGNTAVRWETAREILMDDKGHAMKNYNLLHTGRCLGD